MGTRNLVVGVVFSVCSVVAVAACAGKQDPPPPDPAQEVSQLIKLYQEARPKFVVQKQQMIQADDCDRATTLREAIDRMAADAAMSTEDTTVITQVQMELQQAEKECLAK